MPPSLAEKSQWYYKAFCAKHLPSFADTPNCTHPIFNGKNTGHGYLDLDPEAQGFLAIPFCALLYLNIIDKKSSDSPIRKFKEYLRRLNDDLDILSTKEIEIAKYCFAEPPAAAIETIRVRKLLRRNFLKTKKDKAVRSFNEAMAVAFNGACDLTLINSINVLQDRKLHGIPQDCWVATCDKKLFEFSKIAHYVSLDGEAGKFFQPTILPEHSRDIYWQQANLSHQSLLSSRSEYHQVRKKDIPSLVGKAKASIEEAALAFPEA